MKLEKLLLTKKEIPIVHNTYFTIPIHPKLLDDDVIIDETLAEKVFAEVVDDWYDELIKTYSFLDKDTIKYIENNFLVKPSVIIDNYGSQIVSPPGIWKDDVLTLENGFAFSLSINRNVGGSLNLKREPTFISPSFGVKFTQEKFREFRIRESDIDRDCSKGVLYAYIYDYDSHNIDHYPGALFLRNWAIMYINEVFTQHYNELFG